MSFSLMKLLIWGSLGLGALGVTDAKAQTKGPLPPPTSTPPTSLPPIPRDMVLPRVNLPPLPPANQPPVGTPGTAPAVTQEAVAEADPYAPELLEGMMEAEIQRLNQALAPTMKAVLLRTDNPQFRQYVASGLLQMSSREFAKHDHGLAGMVAVGGKHNGVQTPVCYVLFDAERGEGLWKQYIVPLKQVSHPQSGAAWLMGHEVGHCLDQMDRSGKINKRLSWTADQAIGIGLWPQSIANAYGTNFSKDTFLADPYRLYAQPGQQQFGERVADAFATLWMMKLGGTVKAVEILREQRLRMDPSKPHFAGPVFDLSLDQRERALAMGRVDALWNTARDIQRKAGVSPETNSVDAGFLAGRKQPAEDPKNRKIVRWVVTAQGPVPLDADGNVVPQSVPLHTIPKNFNQLPRFGQ